MNHNRFGDETAASVIIPAHNAGKTLPRQLDALTRQDSSISFEVIVVVNRSLDNTFNIAMSYSDRLNLKVIEANQIPSASYARNEGASESKADFLLFCDADDQVDPHWVSEMLKPLIAQTADFVGGKVQIDKLNLPTWIYEWRYSSLDLRCVQMHNWMPYSLSASLGVTRSAFESVQGFDLDFREAGAEDVDFCRRLLQQGYRIGEAEKAILLYSPRRTLRECLRQIRSYARGNCVLAQKESEIPLAKSWLRMCGSVTKNLLRRMLRQKDFNPLSLIGRSFQIVIYWNEQRQFSRRNAARQQSLPIRADFSTPLSAPVIGGLAFAIERKEDAFWYSGQGLELQTLTVLTRYLKEGHRFIDVGANVGVFSVLAAKIVGEKGHVYSFEPSLRSIPLFEENIHRHKVEEIVELFPVAVGGEAGESNFRIYENSLVSGFGSAPATSFPGQLLSEACVPVVNLSKVVGEPVDVIKVDVEGFELEVLRGAEDLINRNVNTIVIFEFNPSALSSAAKSPGELIEFFSENEWDLLVLDDPNSRTVGRTLKTFDRLRWEIDSTNDPMWFINILAIRKSNSITSLAGE